jgi:hypothetical protein
MAVLTRGENVMLRLDPVEPLGAFPETHNHFINFVIHRNQSLSRFRLTCANQDCTAEEVNVAPLYSLDLTPTHRSAKRQGHGSLSTLPLFILSRGVQQP